MLYEVITLFHPKMVAFEKQGDIHHVRDGATWMCRDEIGYDALAQAEAAALCPEVPKKGFEFLRPRFAHDAGHPFANRLWGDLEQSPSYNFV